jgi:hypothetical protein
MLDTLRNAWAQVLSLSLGLWLMAAPAVLGYGPPAADVHRILGPIAAAFALMAIWGHMRPLRWMNLLFGGLLVVLPFVFGFATVATVNSVVIGLALGGLGFVRGRVTERFGGGWSSIWTGDIAGSRDDWLIR